MEQDFEHLLKLGYNVTSHIVMCKYGKIFRGNKVGDNLRKKVSYLKILFLPCFFCTKIQFAEIYGAKGVLLFDDRSATSIVSEYIYPRGEFLPRDGVQRGTVMLLDGDPHTFNYPSNGMHRNLFNARSIYILFIFFVFD